MTAAARTEHWTLNDTIVAVDNRVEIQPGAKLHAETVGTNPLLKVRTSSVLDFISSGNSAFTNGGQTFRIQSSSVAFGSNVSLANSGGGSG